MKYNFQKHNVGIMINSKILASINLFLIPIIGNGKIGFIDKNAKIIIKPQFEEMQDDFLTKDSFVRVKSNSKWGVIDASGKVRIPFNNQEINKYGDRLYEIRVGLGGRDSRGLVDSNNNIVVPIGIYGNFYYYKEFAIIITLDNKYGAMDKHGAVIIPPIYDSIEWTQNTDPILTAKLGDEIIKFNLDLLR